jgi:hypothetical protein
LISTTIPITICKWPVTVRYDRLSNFTHLQEGDEVWVHRTIQSKVTKVPAILWRLIQGNYRIEAVVHRIQRHREAKVMVVHPKRLAANLGATRDEKLWEGS